ncbi:hypothetical protein ACIHCX_10900 [Streptomyces sp. NPDC052043]|uniref:hypothetical protein n=1 Tax=Streptomyces sp. NPDC052043 TaxID=3365684 RepID=UPI0037D1C675
MSARDEALAAFMRAGYGSDGAIRLADRIEAEALDRITAQRPVNTTLQRAREAVAALFEAETGERRPAWRVIYTDSESPTGVAPICTAEGVDDEHHVIDDHPSGPRRDDEGVYDCCPWPQFETDSPVVAAYLVELLNAEPEEKDTRGGSPHQGESTRRPTQAGGAR